MKFTIERAELVKMIKQCQQVKSFTGKSGHMLRVWACQARVFVEANQTIAGIEALVFRDGTAVVERVKFLKVLQTYKDRPNLSIEADANGLRVGNTKMGLFCYLPEAEPPSLTTDQLPEMSAEAWRNTGLGLLMLFSQAYFRLLESAIGVPCSAVDMNLNHSYLWILKSIRNLLARHPDLADFPILFEPIFPNLYPSTTRDVDWEDMVEPDAGRFLSTVQAYVAEKGIYEPEKESPDWVVMKMFRAEVEAAIDAGITYRKHMRQYFQKILNANQQRFGRNTSATTTESRLAEAARSGGPEERTALQELQDDVRHIKRMASPLGGAVANLEKGVATVQLHVRGVPILQAELDEARRVPEALALEIQNRIADILTPKEQEIWRAMRNAGGSQKDALPSLRQTGSVGSAATLSRRVQEINEKLVRNQLPKCDAPAPLTRFKRSGGYENEDGEAVPKEISPVESDWAEDPTERDTTIRSYLAARPEEQAHFHQTKPGIEDEAEIYLKRDLMKSG